MCIFLNLRKKAIPTHILFVSVHLFYSKWIESLDHFAGNNLLTNPLNANPCLSLFDHFVKFALKGLIL